MTKRATFSDIRELVPHGGPMVLLDRVVACDEDSLSADVTIHNNSLFMRDGRVGSWVGLEYMAQAVAAFAGHQAYQRGERPKLGFLLGSRHYECNAPYFPIGVRLIVTVRQDLRGDAGLAAFAGSIAAEGIVASATLTVFQPANAEQYLRESRE